MISFSGFLIAYLVLYVFTSVFEWVIEKMNVDHLRKHKGSVPKTFHGMIDQNELEKITQYTIDNTRFSMVQSIITGIFFLAVILFGFLPWLAGKVSGLPFVPAGLIFFAGPAVLMSIIAIPFDYYHNFGIEQRYGFNTKTIQIWVSDWIKAVLLATVIGGVLLTLLLFLLKYSGKTWWLWSWIVFFAFQLLMTVIYPTWIAPIFNKFTPLENDELAEKIKSLAEREGLNLKGIFQMDAAKRSRHSNAYFTGLGKTRRIVLFDTLIQSHTADEIQAILAHEIGHLKLKHIKKQLLLMSVISFFLFYLASLGVSWKLMYVGFGFTSTPLYAGLFLIGILWGPIGFFLSPMGMAISRRYERQADLYGIKCTKAPLVLAGALKKLAKDNLSNLRPHPFYVWLKYSYPPLLERIRHIEAQENEGFK